MNAYFSEARKKYHANLLNSILTVGSNGIPSNADKDSRLSIQIAKGITNLLESNVGVKVKAAGQTIGSQFELINEYSHLYDLHEISRTPNLRYYRK